MAEYEPATAGRETSLLLEVLAQTFKGDVRGSLDEFEVKFRRYERSCNEVLSDRVKIAVVQKGIEDEDLRRHVFMHASRLSTYPLVREEIRSIIMARETLNGPTPMDVSAVYKGKGKGKMGKGKSKGKSDDKGKEKDPTANPDAEMICYDAVPSGTPSRVSMIELDDWILAVNVEEHEKMVGSIERVMVESGAAVSVCPLGYAPDIPMTNHSRRATLRTATGAHTEHAAQKTVEYENSDGGSVTVSFEVADVKGRWWRLADGHTQR